MNVLQFPLHHVSHCLASEFDLFSVSLVDFLNFRVSKNLVQGNHPGIYRDDTS